ncbi:NAD(+) kinase, partial [Francisella tularensis subsp. holarctica]|nr:NAD(+) kinase [Francisella tularensis subsp. holarctica]
NKGKIGILTTLAADDSAIKNDLYAILKGDSSVTKISMLKCRVDNKFRAPLEASISLNHIAITARRRLMFGLKVFID